MKSGRSLPGAASLVLTVLISVSFAEEQGEPAPWGDLRIRELMIQAPDSLLDLAETPSSITVWRFPGKKTADLEGYFSDILSDPELKKMVYEEAPVQELELETRVFPSNRFLFRLPGAEREKIYRQLVSFPENSLHRHPVLIHSKSVRSWFPPGVLPEEALEAIEQLSYPQGSSLAFSDLPVLLSMISTEKEERTLKRALSFHRTWLVGIRTTPGEPSDALKCYWTAGGKYPEALPILNAMWDNPEMVEVDLAHLLPPIPRMKLNSFPSQKDGLLGSYPDGFWMSLNFFAETPNPDFRERDLALAQLEERFARVEPPYRYGDVLVLGDPVSKKPIHACVFLAHDLAFTKNGAYLLEPFVISKISDIISEYSNIGTPEVQGWREKP